MNTTQRNTGSQEMTDAIRVPLINVQTLGAKAGYGEGKTRDEAIADALARAKQIDPNAKYDAQCGGVTFAGGMNC